MSRAEMRRQQRENAKALNVIKKAGFPCFKAPLAPMRMTGLSDQELSNMTGVKIGALEQWRKEQTEQIRKAAIAEAQEKLDQAENFITLCNVITSLKALEGFRYGKAAAAYMLEHYSESVVTSERQNIRNTYQELHDKWGIEIEFDEPELNKELGFDEVDWMENYIGYHIPYSVYEKIWNDSKNIQSVITQLAVLWELCEDFSFAKHKKGSETMLMKFMRGTKEKYDKLDLMEHGIAYGTKLLKEKYDVEVAWGEGTQKTLERFDL